MSWEKKNHLFWGKSSMWWREACLEMSVCLYSTGRDASMSVFHSMTVNPHYSGGLINLLLLKMPKHFSCERLKIALQFAFFLLLLLLFVICTVAIIRRSHMTLKPVIIVKLVICCAWVITACQTVAPKGFSQQLKSSMEGCSEHMLLLPYGRAHPC